MVNGLTVEEVLPTGYQASSSSDENETNGLDFTNTQLTTEVSGSKTWITSAPIADVCVVWGKLDGKVAGFIIEREIPAEMTAAANSSGS